MSRDEIQAAVAARYAGLARAARAGQAISDGDSDASPSGGCYVAPGYADVGDVPEAAVRASLGCGNPVAVADLRPGETAGFTGIIITPAQQAGDGVHSAIIGAVKPASRPLARRDPDRAPQPSRVTRSPGPGAAVAR